MVEGEILVTIKLNTPFIEFYEIIKDTACEESLTWLAPYIGKTMGEAIDALPVDSRGRWSSWALRAYCDILNAGCHRHMIANIEDPMDAFNVYRRAANLSDADDVALEAKFKGKLPNVEREMASGKVSRRKAVANGRH